MIAALLRLWTVVKEAVVTEVVIGGRVPLAVSLNIAKAFNSLPFSCIVEALCYRGVPV